MYPSSYGSVGFWPMQNGTSTAVSRLHDAGYLTATFHKFWHMKPYSSFPWDLTEDNTFLEGKTKGRIGRSPTLLGEATKQTIAAAKSSNKPFFLVVNSADTHKPFAGGQAERNIMDREHVDEPSRTYNASEVNIPAPLPDLPGVRSDLAEYASSMRRLDDTVGKCLEALDAAGVADDTVVMFVSDNGMPMPFGKFETYRDSLNGPLVARWPGRFTPGVDAESLVSLIDIAPTIIEIAGADALPDIDGRSLLPLIDEQPDLVWRDVVVGTRYEDIMYGAGKVCKTVLSSMHRFDCKLTLIYFSSIQLSDADRERLRELGWVDAPENKMKRTMNKRGITDGEFHYIYNHFFDGANLVEAFPYNGGRSYKAMQEAAVTDGDMAARLEFYKYRAQEEFYNTISDPGAMNNLINDPTVMVDIANLKEKLLDWMLETNDPIAADYQAFLSGS